MYKSFIGFDFQIQNGRFLSDEKFLLRQNKNFFISLGKVVIPNLEPPCASAMSYIFLALRSLSKQ